MNTTDDHQSGQPLGLASTYGLGQEPERDAFGVLGPCRRCGGKPYEYDMRGTDTVELCTVECGSCDWSVIANTAGEAAQAWNGRAERSR